MVSLFFFRKQIHKENDLLDELRIAASSFDAHEAMVVTDAEGKILKVNQAFTRITGYLANEVVGKKLCEINELHNKHKELHKMILRELKRKGHWNGEIESYSRGRRRMLKASIALIKNEQGEVTHIIAQFLDISNLKKAEQDAMYQAAHDFLTRLPNRKSMMKRLKEEHSRALRTGSKNAFLFIDIDDFKKINDQYGHAIGDKVLIKTAKVLKSCVRLEDYVARISGDEFCVMLLDIPQRDNWSVYHAAQATCEKILRYLSRPLMIEDHKIQLTVSIGVKFFPDSTKDVNSVINDADTAMYLAKDKGKNNYVFFNKEIEEKVENIGRMQDELKRALQQKEFIFHFQPKVDLNTEEIVGAELLVRWKHPSGKLYFPDDFLDVARNMKMIPQITMEALETACLFLKKYDKQYQGSLSINISAWELSLGGFVDEVKHMIYAYGVDPGRIEMEIVEDELIEDFNLIIANMQMLGEFGIRFDIDDFGRGYSSINYLQKLPVDTLKIDRYFMQGLDKPENRELIKMVVSIAKTFHLGCVIEGVEDKDQLAFIKDCDADQYQGYFVSKPIEEQAFMTFVSDWNEHNKQAD